MLRLERGLRTIRARLVILSLITVLLVPVAGPADATPAGYKADGMPFWTYKDRADAEQKNEGGYAPFSDSGGNPASGSMYTVSPHGAYSTTGNKCKVCHAAKRAEGAYFMLRADSAADACNYCHIGGSAHSSKVVYTLNSAGTSTPNGHTIGASPIIPDSSVEQWLETVELSTIDADGNPVRENVQVRRYSAHRNKMFRFARKHGHEAPGSGSNGFLRVGPLALSCLNCHNAHNDANNIWRPAALETGARLQDGYKLLRRSPSASIWGTATFYGDDGTAVYTEDYDEGMRQWKAYTGYDPARGRVYVNSANIIAVPEADLSATTTGYGHTIYTLYEGVEPARREGPERDPQTVNQYALSPWCADCHNLNIGYRKHLTNEELGYKSHSDRTHPAPYTGACNGPAQCYSCHRNDLPETPSTSYYNAGALSCESCHFGTGTYKAVNDDLNGDGSPGDISDFPHSGHDNSIKMLGNYVGYMDDAGNRRTKVVSLTPQELDGVCMRCHTGIGTNH